MYINLNNFRSGTWRCERSTWTTGNQRREGTSGCNQSVSLPFHFCSWRSLILPESWSIQNFTRLKGQCHFRCMRVLMRKKHFEIVGPIFSNTVGEFWKLFSSVWIAVIFGKLAEFFYLQHSLVITEAFCCDIFESFCNGGKAKIPRRVVCKLVSVGLHGARVVVDIVPFRNTLGKFARNITNMVPIFLHDQFMVVILCDLSTFFFSG